MINNLAGKKRQQGLTVGGWLLVLALIGFFVLLVLKLFPIYSNHYKIKNVLELLEKEQNIYRMQRKKILSFIRRRNDINFVEGFKQEHLVIKILRSGNKEIHITYEDRRPILGNLDVVAKFDDYFIVTPDGQVKSGNALH